MPPHALSARYPHVHALAAGWDVLHGTLALPGAVPAPGAAVLVDGALGSTPFRLEGRVVPGPRGERLVEVARSGRPVVEALLEGGGG